eukprot:1161341-Pelagomonas_calceolata.AAC.8
MHVCGGCGGDGGGHRGTRGSHAALLMGLPGPGPHDPRKPPPNGHLYTVPTQIPTFTVYP